MAAAASGSRMIERALAILDLFTEARPEWSVGEIAPAVALPISTSYRIVGTLLSHGLLRQAGGGLRLGAAALALGRRAAAGFDLRATLHGVLVGLAAETQETGVLSVLDETSLVSLCIDRVEGQQQLRLALEVGRLTPLHTGASSKALLAFAPPRIQEAILAGSLEPLGPRALTDPDALRAELARVRAVGFAASQEETNEGAWGLSAPILAADGTLLASIGIAGPLLRYSPEAHEHARAAVLAASRRAADLLGVVVDGPRGSVGEHAQAQA